MTLHEIKDAVADGKTVYCGNQNYKVMLDRLSRFLIVCDNGYIIGLTWADGITLNGKPSDFFILEQQ